MKATSTRLSKFIFTLASASILLLSTSCQNGPDGALLALPELSAGEPFPENEPGGPPDSTAPGVVAVHPSNDEADIPIHAGFTIQFSEPVSSATIQVNTANTNCTGSVQLSQNGFLSCEKLQFPEIWTSTVSAVSVIPFQPLGTDQEYEIRLSTAITDTAGNPLPHQFQSSFKTAEANTKSITLSCTTSRLTSLEYLFDPAASQALCWAQPTDPNRIIREIRLKSTMSKRDGSGFIDATYNNQNEIVLPYNNDAQKIKEFWFENQKFTPAFGTKQTWVDHDQLRVNTTVTYSDGQSYTTYIDIALHHTAIMGDGPVYMVWVDMEISNLGPQTGELPKAQWRAWTAAKYPNGQELRSPVKVVPASGFLLVDLNEVARTTAPPTEQISIYLETTGDDTPDYVWEVPPFNVAPSGTVIRLWATGLFVGGKNVIQPVQFL